jgi:hypothetical protein
VKLARKALELRGKSQHQCGVDAFGSPPATGSPNLYKPMGMDQFIEMCCAVGLPFHKSS